MRWIFMFAPQLAKAVPKCGTNQQRFEIQDIKA